MSTEPVRIERRSTQRFDFQLPVSVRLAGSEREGHGFTQNLGARGALFYTDFPLTAGDAVELTLQMPSEITLGETMRVRCLGKVTRIVPSAGGTARGVAVRLEGYEYLPEAETVAQRASAFGRVSALHHSPEEEEAAVTLHRFHPRPAVVP
jgi:hypothetical protein